MCDRSAARGEQRARVGARSLDAAARDLAVLEAQLHLEQQIVSDHRRLAARAGGGERRLQVAMRKVALALEHDRVLRAAALAGVARADALDARARGEALD